MAQMPRGEPRTVPDPAGDQYDEMLREEWQRRRRAEAAAAKPQLLNDIDLKAALFPPAERRFDFDDPRQPRTGRIGGQTYREIDNGRANVLVPVAKASPAELAERQRAVERHMFMTELPFAGIAYGVATMANASPQTRDRAMIAGGLANTAMLGAAPRAARIRGPAAGPQGKLGDPDLRRPDIRYREHNAREQPTGAESALTAPLLGRGTETNRRRNPPGWGGHGTRNNEARAHLLARRLGGSGKDPQNIVTLTHKGANTPQMSTFENRVARRVRAGEVVNYSVTPLYKGEPLQPHSILLTAHGSRSALPSVGLIRNPAWYRK